MSTTNVPLEEATSSTPRHDTYGTGYTQPPLGALIEVRGTNSQYHDVLKQTTLPRVQMPNRHGFVADPRPDVPARKPK